MHRVLLVDPDQSIANSVVEYFSHHNITVSWAVSPQQALRFLEEQPPDVVILECALGKHGGLELLHEYKSYPEWQAIPTVVFSHQNLQSYIDRMTVLGVNAVLYKPQTTLRQLHDQVMELV